MSVCKFCGSEFKPAREWQVYCSSLCRIRQNTVSTNPAHAKNVRRYKLKNQYGITPEQYDAMLAAQSGVCNICGRVPQNGRFHIDHNHQSGTVRGILCPKCNQQLGWLEKYSDAIARHRQS